MLRAFFLTLSQLPDRRILAVLFKSLALTAVIVVAVGWMLFELLAGWMRQWASQPDWLPAVSGMRELALALFLLLSSWLLFRVVALVVLQFFADDVVAAVEHRHYPAALAAASPPGWRTEMRLGLGGAARALLANLLALPLLIVLLVTGIGTAIVFWVLNAWLLGRELGDMVWLRHAQGEPALPQIDRATRFALGGVVAALMLVPFVNLLAPLIGAAMATHLLHGKGAPAHAA